MLILLRVVLILLILLLLPSYDCMRLSPIQLRKLVAASVFFVNPTQSSIAEEPKLEFFKVIDTSKVGEVLYDETEKTLVKEKLIKTEKEWKALVMKGKCAPI